MAKNLLFLFIGLGVGVTATWGTMRHEQQTSWEYTVIWMASPGDTQPSYVSDLNNMGAKGWRVVGALAGRGNGEGELILERQK